MADPAMVEFLSGHGRRGPRALVVDMTEADSDEDEDCESDGGSDFVRSGRH